MQQQRSTTRYGLSVRCYCTWTTFLPPLFVPPHDHLAPYESRTRVAAPLAPRRSKHATLHTQRTAYPALHSFLPTLRHLHLPLTHMLLGRLLLRPLLV